MPNKVQWLRTIIDELNLICDKMKAMRCEKPFLGPLSRSEIEAAEELIGKAVGNHLQQLLREWK